MWGGAKHMGVYEPRLEKPRVSHRTGPSRAGPSRAEPGPSWARPCRASRVRPSCPGPSRAVPSRALLCGEGLWVSPWGARIPHVGSLVLVLFNARCKRGSAIYIYMS